MLAGTIDEIEHETRAVEADAEALERAHPSVDGIGEGEVGILTARHVTCRGLAQVPRLQDLCSVLGRKRLQGTACTSVCKRCQLV